jgi:hypothetical protein
MGAVMILAEPLGRRRRRSPIRQAWLALLAAVMLFAGRAAFAADIVTDANIVTGLDMSYSIEPAQMRLEIEGLAQAIRSPEVLAAIQSGRTGRVGFAVFAWHHDKFPVLVEWTLIATEPDAQAAARAIEARLLVDVDAEARRQQTFFIGRLTNVSQAIDHAAAMLLTAPFVADRSVVNIIGNGEDNVGEDAHRARDRLVDSGAVVNGVVLGSDPLVLDYYRREVAGGPGAFVMATAEPETMVEALTRKFLYDIAAGGSAHAEGTLLAARE